MSDLTSLLGRLDQWLSIHRAHYYAALPAAATTRQLDALEKKLTLTVPVELRALLSWHNGQSDESLGSFEQNWRLMSATQIAEDRTMDPGWRAAWLPFLSDGYGNYLCLDTSQTPPPVRAFWAGNAEHPIVAKSLTRWMEEFVSAVEAGRYVEEPERGTFLRRS